MNTLVFVLCLPASGAEVSHFLGQGSSLRSEAGAAHPDGPPSQPHALHRCQVTKVPSCLHHISIPSFSFDEVASLQWQLVVLNVKLRLNVLALS